MNKGFTTLEIIIAMTIMVIVLSSVVLISFGTQMSLAGAETAAEALKRAQALLERQQALARKDFGLVNATTSSDEFYTDTISVELRPNFLTKEVTINVDWENERGLEQGVELKTLITDFSSSVGGSTCNSSPSGDWANPISHSYPLRAPDLLPPGEIGTYPITDLDAYRGRLYVTVGPTAGNTDKTFFVFDISNQAIRPIYLGGTDNAGNTRSGLNAVRVAGDYAYVANAHDANFNSCSVGPSCSQFQVIDVSSPSGNWNPAIISLKLATSTEARVSSSGGDGQAIGKSIFYKDGYVYLGLSRTESGPEFHIIDVHAPLSPFWVGSWPPSGTSSLQPVNALFIRNGYAYLAHPTESANSPQEQLTILNVSNPRSPTRVGGFHAGNNEGNGKSLVAVGDSLYFGRTETVFSSGSEFYILDIANPPSTVSLGNFATNDSVNDLLVRDFLSFLLTNSSLEILQTNHPTEITRFVPLPLPGGSAGRALDCEGNYLYVGSADASGNGYITVITGS